jgi:DNA-binding CsgD family transcriptional regulator
MRGLTLIMRGSIVLLMTPQATATAERRIRVKELHSEGMSNREISMSLKCTRNSVKKDLDSFGLVSHQAKKNPRGPREPKVITTPGGGRTRSEDTILLCKEALHDYRDTFDEFQIAILEMILESKRSADIASELGVDVSKVDNTIAGAKLRLKRQGKLLKTQSAIDKRREEITKLHSQGMFTKDIASALGLNRNSVYYDLEYLGLKSNGIGFQPKQSHDLFTRAEAKEICKRTERRVMERRLARGWTIADIMGADSSDRQYVLDQFMYLGLEIPEGEAWVNDRITKERRPYVQSKRMRREISTIPQKDTWKTKASS